MSMYRRNNLDFKECLMVVFAISTIIFFLVFLLCLLIITTLSFEITKTHQNIILISFSLFTVSLICLSITGLYRRCIYEHEIDIENMEE